MPWIPVGERLPEEPTYATIIVCVTGGGVTVARYCRGRWSEEVGDDSWDIDVTHWQPLPDPPEKEIE